MRQLLRVRQALPSGLARSGTPFQVGPDVYVNSVAAWNSLTAASQSSLLATLHSKERQFQAVGAKVFPPVSSFTVSSASDASSAGALGTGSTLLAAHISGGPVPAEADFGATGLGDLPLVPGSAPYDHSPTAGMDAVRYAATPLPGTPTLDVMRRQLVGGTGYVSQLGMAAALITASGVAANRAELPVTATYRNQSGHQAKVIVTASAASISVSFHAQVGVGCEPQQLLYVTPSSGHLALSCLIRCSRT